MKPEEISELQAERTEVYVETLVVNVIQNDRSLSMRLLMTSVLHSSIAMCC